MLFVGTSIIHPSTEGVFLLCNILDLLIYSLEFILGQLSELEEITYRAMMGEFIIYYRGKIVGGIYDDRLLVKPVKAAISYMPTAPYELPYEGAKQMLLVDEVDNKNFLAGLFNAMYEELPAQNRKRRNK